MIRSSILNKFLVVVISCFITSSSLASPSKSFKEQTPPLISAIQKESPELYSKEMRCLLDGPGEEFANTLMFKSDKGDTIFHLMAGVRSHQKFFSEEISKLAKLFTIQEKPIESLSIADVQILIPNLKDTKLAEAIKSKKE